MAVQATLKVNPSLKQKLALLEQTAEDKVRDVLVDIAQTAVRLSPVDTGAYVTSHSFKTNTSSRGRGKSSRNKPKKQNQQSMRQEGLDNLVQDINALDLSALAQLLFTSDSVADLNRDGWVNGMDVTIAIENLYQEGEKP